MVNKSNEAYRTGVQSYLRDIRSKYSTSDSELKLAESILNGTYRNGTGKGSRTYNGIGVNTYAGRMKAVAEVLDLKKTKSRSAYNGLIDLLGKRSNVDTTSLNHQWAKSQLIDMREEAANQPVYRGAPTLYHRFKKQAGNVAAAAVFGVASLLQTGCAHLGISKPNYADKPKQGIVQVDSTNRHDNLSAPFVTLNTNDYDNVKITTSTNAAPLTAIASTNVPVASAASTNSVATNASAYVSIPTNAPVASTNVPVASVPQTNNVPVASVSSTNNTPLAFPDSRKLFVLPEVYAGSRGVSAGAFLEYLDRENDLGAKAGYEKSSESDQLTIAAALFDLSPFKLDLIVAGYLGENYTGGSGAIRKSIWGGENYDVSAGIGAHILSFEGNDSENASGVDADLRASRYFTLIGVPLIGSLGLNGSTDKTGVGNFSAGIQFYSSIDFFGNGFSKMSKEAKAWALRHPIVTIPLGALEDRARELPPNNNNNNNNRNNNNQNNNQQNNNTHHNGGGDTSNGNTSGGNTSGGNTSGGNTSGGNTSNTANTSNTGEVSSGYIPGDEGSVGY